MNINIKRIIPALLAMALVLTMFIMGVGGIKVQAAEVETRKSPKQIHITAESEWSWNVADAENTHGQVFDVDDLVTDWLLLRDCSGSLQLTEEQAEMEAAKYFGTVKFVDKDSFDTTVHDDFSHVSRSDTDIVGAILSSRQKAEHIVVVTDGKQDPADYSALYGARCGDMDLHIVFVGTVDKAAASELITKLVENLEDTSITTYNLACKGEVVNYKEGYVRRTINLECCDEEYLKQIAELQSNLEGVISDLNTSEAEKLFMQLQIEQLQQQVDDANMSVNAAIGSYLRDDPEMASFFLLFCAIGLIFTGAFILFFVGYKEDHRHWERMEKVKVWQLLVKALGDADDTTNAS